MYYTMQICLYVGIPRYSYCRNVEQRKASLSINQDRKYLAHKAICTAKDPISEKIIILDNKCLVKNHMN